MNKNEKAHQDQVKLMNDNNTKTKLKNNNKKKAAVLSRALNENNSLMWIMMDSGKQLIF